MKRPSASFSDEPGVHSGRLPSPRCSADSSTEGQPRPLFWRARAQRPVALARGPQGAAAAAAAAPAEPPTGAASASAFVDDSRRARARRAAVRKNPVGRPDEKNLGGRPAAVHQLRRQAARRGLRLLVGGDSGDSHPPRSAGAPARPGPRARPSPARDVRLSIFTRPTLAPTSSAPLCLQRRFASSCRLSFTLARLFAVNRPACQSTPLVECGVHPSLELSAITAVPSSSDFL